MTFQNAFLKAIHVRHLTAEDYRREGELLWKDCADNFTTESLIVAEMDFSDIYKSYKIKEEQRAPSVSAACPPAGGSGGSPPPPPPLPPPATNGSRSPPPPPPPPSLSSEYIKFCNIHKLIKPFEILQRLRLLRLPLGCPQPQCPGLKRGLTSTPCIGNRFSDLRLQPPLSGVTCLV